MRASNDASQLRYLLKVTIFGGITWIPVPKNEAFTAKLPGGSVATVWKDKVGQYFKLQDRLEQTQMLVSGADCGAVDVLYLEAERRAFSLHKAIAYVALRSA